MHNTLPPPAGGPAAIRCNWEDWLPYIEDVSIPDAQKRELIESLWLIVVGFVDLGWEVRTDAPDTEKSGGQILDLADALSAAVVNSKNTDTHEEAL